MKTETTLKKTLGKFQVTQLLSESAGDGTEKWINISLKIVRSPLPGKERSWRAPWHCVFFSPSSCLQCQRAQIQMGDESQVCNWGFILFLWHTPGEQQPCFQHHPHPGSGCSTPQIALCSWRTSLPLAVPLTYPSSMQIWEGMALEFSKNLIFCAPLGYLNGERAIWLKGEIGTAPW